MTKKQQAAWQARRDELERRDRQQREGVIAEFAAGDPDATLQAMAAEILRYRARLAEARSAAEPRRRSEGNVQGSEGVQSARQALIVDGE